jgi:hypothetical protein
MNHQSSAMLILGLVLVGLPGERLRAADPAASGTATLTGWVSNAATGDLLRGATVQLPGLGITDLTSDTGSYLLHGVPPGEHEVVVTYAGLDAARERLAVSPGVTLRRNFDLTSSVYTLGAFTVSGQREGGAAAITTQSSRRCLHMALMSMQRIMYGQ